MGSAQNAGSPIMAQNTPGTAPSATTARITDRMSRGPACLLSDRRPLLAARFCNAIRPLRQSLTIRFCRLSLCRWRPVALGRPRVRRPAAVSRTPSSPSSPQAPGDGLIETPQRVECRRVNSTDRCPEVVVEVSRASVVNAGNVELFIFRREAMPAHVLGVVSYNGLRLVFEDWRDQQLDRVGSHHDVAVDEQEHPAGKIGSAQIPCDRIAPRPTSSLSHHGKMRKEMIQ